MFPKAIIKLKKIDINASLAGSSRGYIPWLDYAKIIGIFLMIWGHAAHSSPGVRLYIWSFHMPLFFIISGMLYKPLTLKETLKKDWRTLAVPYFLLNFVCWAYLFAVLTVKGLMSITWLTQTGGAILFGLGYETGHFQPVSTACWFIYALFLIRIILAVFYRGRQRNLLYLSAFGIAATVFLQRMDIDLWMPLDSALLVLPFVCAGIAFRSVMTRFAEWGGRWSWAALFALLALWCWLAACNGRVDANTCNPGNSLALYYIVAILGTLLLFRCSQIAYNALSLNILRGG